MKKIILFSIVLSFFINSCCGSKITLEEKEKWNTEIYGKEPFIRNQIPTIKVNIKEFYDFYGYIFPKEYQPFGGEDRFTPSIEDVKKAEERYNTKSKSLPQLKKINFRKRYRQYIGYYENNKKVIGINFVKINKDCFNKSEYGYLINKWFIQTSDYEGQWKTYLFDRIVIDK